MFPHFSASFELWVRLARPCSFGVEVGLKLARVRGELHRGDFVGLLVDPCLDAICLRVRVRDRDTRRSGCAARGPCWQGLRNWGGDAGLSGRRQRVKYPLAYAADGRKRHFPDGEVAPFDFLLPPPCVEVRAVLAQFADQRSELRSADYCPAPGRNAGEC